MPDVRSDAPVSALRVLLADDHALVAGGFRALLRELAFDVVGEARDGVEALRLIKLHKPEVVLMDIAMPALNGLETTAQVTQEFPAVRVIILSMHASAEYARRALRRRLRISLEGLDRSRARFRDQGRGSRRRIFQPGSREIHYGGLRARSSA
jgi:chemotaxis response regulator CheB